MRTKFIRMLMCCFCSLVLLSGCEDKTALSGEQFKTMMTDKGYSVEDASGQIEEGYAKSVYIALKDGIHIEFYEANDVDLAKDAYEGNKGNIESMKGSVSTNTEVNLNNYSKYTQSDDIYYVVSRIDNTFIYLEANTDHKEEVNSLLDELGY